MINVLRSKKELLIKLMISLIGAIILSISAYMIYSFAFVGGGEEPESEHPFFLFVYECLPDSIEDFDEPYSEYATYEKNKFSIGYEIEKTVVSFEEMMKDSDALKSSDVLEYINDYLYNWEDYLHYYGITTYEIDLSGISNKDKIDSIIYGQSIFLGETAYLYNEDLIDDDRLVSLSRDELIALNGFMNDQASYYYKDGGNTLVITIPFCFEHEVDLEFDATNFTETLIQNRITNNEGKIDTEFFDEMTYLPSAFNSCYGASVDENVSKVTDLGDHKYLLDVKMNFVRANGFYTDATLIGDIEFIGNNSGYLLKDFCGGDYTIYDDETEYIADTNARKLYVKKTDTEKSELRFQRVVDFNDRKVQIEIDLPENFGDDLDWSNLSSTSYTNKITSNTGATIRRAELVIPGADIDTTYYDTRDTKMFLHITLDLENNTLNDGVNNNFNFIEYRFNDYEPGEYYTMESYNNFTPYKKYIDVEKLYYDDEPGYTKGYNTDETHQYLYEIYIPLDIELDDEYDFEYGFTHEITKEEIESLPQNSDGTYTVTSKWFKDNAYINYVDKDEIINLTNSNDPIGCFYKISNDTYGLIFQLESEKYTFSKLICVNNSPDDFYNVINLGELDFPQSYFRNSDFAVTFNYEFFRGINSSLLISTTINTAEPNYNIALTTLHINDGPDSFNDRLKVIANLENPHSMELMDETKTYYTCDEWDGPFVPLSDYGLTHTSTILGVDNEINPKWVRVKLSYSTYADLSAINTIYFNGRPLTHRYSISGFSPEGEGDTDPEMGEGFSTQGLETGGDELFVYKWIYIGDEEEDTIFIKVNKDLSLSKEESYKELLSSTGEVACLANDKTISIVESDDNNFFGEIDFYDLWEYESKLYPGDLCLTITINEDDFTTNIPWDKIKIKINDNEYVTVPGLCDNTNNMYGKTLGYYEYETSEGKTCLSIIYRYPGEKNKLTITTKKPITKEDIDAITIKDYLGGNSYIYTLLPPFIEEHYDIDFKYFEDIDDNLSAQIYTPDGINYNIVMIFQINNDAYTLLTAMPVTFDNVELQRKNFGEFLSEIELFGKSNYAFTAVTYALEVPRSTLVASKKFTLYDPNAPVPSGGGGSSHKSKTLKVNDEKSTSKVITGDVKENNKITITPKEERKVKDVIIKDKDGNIISVNKNTDGTYSFTMPNKDVYLEIKYKPIEIDMTINSRIAHVDDKKVELETEPEIKNDRTMLPIRFVSETLGAEVSYDKNKETQVQTVHIKKDNIEIEITIGSNKAYINGKEYTLDQGAYIKNDFTYLPVRFVSEALRAKVDWDKTNRKVLIKEFLED